LVLIRESEQLSALLRQWSGGDKAALDGLVQPLYTGLNRLARRELAAYHSSSITPGTLVHEAYLRLRRSAPAQCRDEAHFYAMAARLMRFILVDHLRAQSAAKRKADAVTLTEPADPSGSPLGACLAILDVNDALDALATLDVQKARIVELRFFAGLSLEETAVVAGISVATVKRQWAFSRAWMRKWLTERVA
jgi:RNA polymerase sigma factor (TIGR02999 family)